jgi:hypothetical protein
MRRTDFGGMVCRECPRFRKVGIGTEALAGGLSLLKSIYQAGYHMVGKGFEPEAL